MSNHCLLTEKVVLYFTTLPLIKVFFAENVCMEDEENYFHVKILILGLP